MRNALRAAALALAIAIVLWAVQRGWFSSAGAWVDARVFDFCESWKQAHGADALMGFPPMVFGLLGVALVSLICGTVSSLVVTNRMAFFSDAIAHCAFTGVSLGHILLLLQYVGTDGEIMVMSIFGVLVGLGIAFVKEKTVLSNDTVIGVFFAGAMGLGAILLKNMKKFDPWFSPEALLFGDPLALGGAQLVFLTVLFLAILLFLSSLYNRFVFVSFNPSLARSRNFPVRFSNYLFIVLLGLIVNICFQVVGLLLINALLVLPAATASNLSRSLRQFFWLSTAISVACGLGGLLLSNYWFPVIGGREVDLVSGGTIVVVGVLAFFASMLVGRWVRGDRPSLRPSI